MPPAPKTILVLESPHVDEVRAGHPLAGNSGRAVTRALKRNTSIRSTLEQIERMNQDNEAIGCILKHRPGTLRLGLMNASRLPLQIMVYCSRRKMARPAAFRETDRWYHWQRHSEFLCFLQTVKYNPELLSVEAGHHAFRVYRALLNDLKSRLERLPTGALVVPCGKVARAFVDGVTNLKKYQGEAQIWNRQVPHPSFGHWNQSSNVQNVLSLVNRIYQRSRART